MAIYEGQEIDLPEIPMDNINDLFSEFELKMPFTRTLLTRYMEKVENAERVNGNQGFVTIQQLASELKTPVWQGLNSDADQLYKFMTSGIFKVVGQSADVLDTPRLKIFGLLHCRHTIRKKAHFFYEFLQQGDHVKFPQISAGDKDFAPNFQMICDVACWNFYEALKSIDVVSELYNQGDIEKLKE